MTEFRNRKTLLELGFQADKKEAQDAFREITNSFVLIPEPVYRENKGIIHQLIEGIDSKTCDRLERMRKINELKSYTVAVQLFGKQSDDLIKELNISSAYCQKNLIKTLHGYTYSYEFGVQVDTNWSDLDQRMI